MPVTRMVPEMVNETRTVTVACPRQQTIDQPVTRIVCEPVTVDEEMLSARPGDEERARESSIRPRCTTVIVDKDVTRMIPQCVTEMVPVTRMIPVVRAADSAMSRRRSPSRRWSRW